MKWIYTAKYKCRLCGKTYGDITTDSEETARAIGFRVICGMEQTNPLEPRKYGTHYCDNGSLGVSDFIGFAATLDTGY